MKLRQSPNTQVMMGENITGIKDSAEHPTTVWRTRGDAAISSPPS